MSSLVTCPVCGQYEGKPESVRAHISAKRDEAHSGKTGFDYDSELGLDAGDQNGDREAESPETDPEGSAKQSEASPAQEPVEVPTVESVERDRDGDGNELVKLTLTGAGAYAIAKLLSNRDSGRGEM